MSVHGVVHELGHAFAARFKSGPSNPYTMAGNDPDILSVEGYQTSEHEGMWRANSSTRENESFANTFTGWVYDEFDNDADGIGDHRREFMEDNMNNVWIPILITP
jgi:hypothetical protein